MSERTVAPAPVVLKLGGSLLTDPDEPGSFRASYAVSTAQALAGIDEHLVLVHGTGSFGKPPAGRLGFEDGFLGPDRAEAFAEMEHHLNELRGRVLETLAEARIPAIRLPPAALFRTRDGEIIRAAAEPVRDLVARSVTPVLSGGFVPDERRGFAVCSSDDQAAHLARVLEAERLVYATDAPGVQDRNSSPPETINRLRLTNARIHRVTEAAPEDVSGGMRGKLLAARVAVEAGIPTWIADGREPHRIRALTAGESVKGTRLLPDRTGHSE